MNSFLTAVTLFIIGSVFGWCGELIFRRIINSEKKWINPGFLTGPYLPLYGFGLIILYLLSTFYENISTQNSVLSLIILLAVMAASLTLLEYIAGKIFVIGMNIRLWDYSHMKGNIEGIICPLYSLMWGILGALYYFLLDPHIDKVINYASESLMFIFIIGMFYGFFLIDFIYSANLIAKIRNFAKENNMVVKLEELKLNIKINALKSKEKYKFLFALSPPHSIKSSLKNYREKLKDIELDIRNIKDEIKEKIKHDK